jgi:hypothetical protein
MASEWWTRKGDRGRVFTGTVLLPDGTPMDLSGKTVKIRLRVKGAAALKVDGVATVTDGPAGRILYQPTSGDVDTDGTLYGAVVVDPDGASQVSSPTEFDLVWHIRPGA